MCDGKDILTFLEGMIKAQEQSKEILLENKALFDKRILNTKWNSYDDIGTKLRKRKRVDEALREIQNIDTALMTTEAKLSQLDWIYNRIAEKLERETKG